MEEVFERLYLYALSGQVALLGQSVTQAESLFKAAISLVQEVPKTVVARDGKTLSTSSDLVDFVRYLSSLLLAVPGHPERGAFFLLDPLRQVVKDYQWEAKSTARLSCFSALLATLSACYQRKLPYEWDKIESNELLWGQTESYLSTIRENIEGVLNDVEEELKRLNEFADAAAQKAQADAMIEILLSAVTHLELTPKCAEFTVGLVKRAQSHRATGSELKIVNSTLASLQTSSPAALGQSHSVLKRELDALAGF